MVWHLTAHKFFTFHSGNIFTNPLTGALGRWQMYPEYRQNQPLIPASVTPMTNSTLSDAKWGRFTLPAVRETSYPEGSHTRHARLILGGSKANMAACQMRKGAKHQRTAYRSLSFTLSLSPLNSVKPRAEQSAFTRVWAAQHGTTTMSKYIHCLLLQPVKTPANTQTCTCTKTAWIQNGPYSLSQAMFLVVKCTICMSFKCYMLCF